MSAFVLVAALLTAAAPLKLAAPSLQAVGIDDKKATAFTDYFGQQLQQYGIRVTTSSEVAAMLGHERQKQMIGCSNESSSCVAELAGALGVDGIISGNVAKLEPSGYLMTVKILAASTGASMGSYSGRLPDENAALDWLAATAREFAKARGLVAAEKGIHLRGKAWIPGAAALVIGGLGTVALANSYGIANSLSNGVGNPSDLTHAINEGQASQTIGGILLGVGGAALAATVFLFVTGDEPVKPSVAVVPLQQGGYAQLGWRFP